jgi:aspartate aminotransferase
MVAVLEQAPGGSIILLQACAHNPTGFDPTKSQWKKIAEVIRVRNLLPFFDCAYQGFASGSLERDSFPVRHFIDRGIELVIAQSFAKNLGLYGQRVGCFHYVAPSGAHEVVSRVKSQLAVLQRSQISSPPIYGARVASIVLNDEELFAQWQEDLQTMSSRIVEMRDMLRRELERLQTPGDWSHITGQIGMFSFTGLSEAQVVELRSKWQVYMLTDGRMSMSGLNLGNVKYVAEAVDDVVRRL